MSEDRWNLIQSVFEQALERPPHVRARFISEACGNDDALRREVESLVAAHDGTHPILDGVVLDALQVDLEQDFIGREVGAFRIIRRIGSGGMGSVFLAERTGDFKQQVALKLLRPAVNSAEVIRRFAAERQILARLDHPNIARLFDGGHTDEGIPYFAMEYVDGQPIDEYCDQRRLSVTSRLELFRKVCDAVQYAHRNLVVHRDLKPSNILVTDDAVVKLLDFGIAKILDESDESVLLTRTGQRIMTPAYAAPEQISGGAITTATDVYALGVILYQLLTGRRPFDVARPLHELQQLILSSDPERPSTVVSQVVPGDLDTAPVTPQDVSRARAAPTERLRKLLAGDLDNICLKALRKEPERRYSTADQLATDIRRHLDGLPVEARPDTMSYRARKFVRRHRAGVAATATGVMVVLALTAWYTNSLANQRDVAEQERRKAEEVSNFLIDVFTVVDPEESRGETVSARELLDSATVKIEAGLAGEPEVQATLMRVLGEVYYGLGMNEKAGELYQQALARQHEIYRSPHEELATTQLLMGIISQDAGNVAKADSLFRIAYEARLRLFGPAHADVIESLSLLAFLRETEGEYESADSLHRLVLAGNSRLYEPDHPRVTEAMVKLAGLLRLTDRSEEAEPLLRDALERQERYYGGDHLEIASTMRHIAGILRERGDYAEAESLYARMLHIRRTMLGPDHMEVAHTLNSLSILYTDKGEFERGLAANAEFLEILQKNYPGNHPSLGAAYHNRALMLRDVGDDEQAESYFFRTIDVQDAVLDAGHPNRAFPLVGLANLYRDTGRLAESERMLRRALAIRVASLPPDHRYIADTESDLGATLTDRNKLGEAEEHLLKAYGTFSGILGDGDNRTRRAARRLADLYDAMQQPEKATGFRTLAESD